MTKHIRNSAKAIIIQNQKILVLRKQEALSTYLVLPGGGQRKDETLPQALERECLEEIGSTVFVGELLFVRDYIADHHEFAESEDHVHQVEFFFACSLPEGYRPKGGSEPDPGQIEVCWVALEKLQQLRLYPKALVPYLTELIASQHPIYLGDIN